MYFIFIMLYIINLHSLPTNMIYNSFDNLSKALNIYATIEKFAVIIKHSKKSKSRFLARFDFNKRKLRFIKLKEIEYNKYLLYKINALVKLLSLIFLNKY